MKRLMKKIRKMIRRKPLEVEVEGIERAMWEIHAQLVSISCELRERRMNDE